MTVQQETTFHFLLVRHSETIIFRRKCEYNH